MLAFELVLGCGHVFDLLMRRFHVPLAMMPCPLIRSRRYVVERSRSELACKDENGRDE
jgi:hypothetical protein